MVFACQLFFALLIWASCVYEPARASQDIIGLICLLVVELAFHDFEMWDFIVDNHHASLAPCKRFRAWSLQSLPLIHPL